MPIRAAATHHPAAKGTERVQVALVLAAAPTAATAASRVAQPALIRTAVAEEVREAHVASPSALCDRRGSSETHAHQSAASAASSSTTPSVPSTTRSASSVISEGPSSGSHADANRPGDAAGVGQAHEAGGRRRGRSCRRRRTSRRRRRCRPETFRCPRPCRSAPADAPRAPCAPSGCAARPLRRGRRRRRSRRAPPPRSEPRASGRRRSGPCPRAVRAAAGAPPCLPRGRSRGSAGSSPRASGSTTGSVRPPRRISAPCEPR